MQTLSILVSNQFKIYSSSAGSGKTFTLAVEYLTLALSQPYKNAYRQILAVTFTNDAAKEMKERILSSLREIGGFGEMSDRTQNMLLKIQENLPNEPKEVLQKKAYAMYLDLIENYTDFHVMTIDSFVNRLAKTFARDLNLPFNYEILVNNKNALYQATERLIKKIGSKGNEHISQLILMFAEDLDEQDKYWQSIAQQLAKAAEDLVDDKFLPLIELNQAFTGEDFLLLKKNIDNYFEQLNVKINSLSINALEIFKNAGLSIENVPHKKSGFINIFIKSAENYQNLFEDSFKRALAAANTGVFWSKEETSNTISKYEGIKNKLCDGINELFAIKEAETAKYFVLRAIRNELHHLSLLNYISQEFFSHLYENNQALLSDFNRRINKLIVNEPAPYIFERLGEKYNHIMIDEFQDTSDIQFFNMLPLLENGLSKNMNSMVVGDPKQAIYRFRAGNPAIMIHLMKPEISPLQTTNLSFLQNESLAFTTELTKTYRLPNNFRSKREIIAFNNDFFGHLAQSQTEPLIKSAYQDIHQECPGGSSEGAHIEINCKPIDSDDFYLNEILQIIENALSKQYHFKDIAILCRDKKKGQKIITQLLEHNLPVSSPDALQIGNNPAIQTLIYFLKSAYYPEDKFIRNTFLLLFYQHLGLNPPNPKQIEDLGDADIFEACMKMGYPVNKENWSSYSFFQIAEIVIKSLKMFENKLIDRSFIFAFLDILAEFDKMSKNHTDFFEFWDNEYKNRSVEVLSSDAITVTTIHKSKGLEYPIVILPYCNWSLKPPNTHKIWYKLDNLDYPELTTGSKKLQAAKLSTNDKIKNTALEAQVNNELNATLLDEINILYVAFTRPTDALYVLTEPGKGNDVYQILENYLLKLGKQLKNEKHIIAQGVFQPKKHPTVTHSDILINSVFSEANTGNLAFKALSIENESPRLYGNQMHTLFSHIHSKNDLENALQIVLDKGIIGLNDIDHFRKEALQILNLSLLNGLFDDDLTVLLEQDILEKNKPAKRPDRIVIKNEMVSVIDFKTGTPLPSHEQQIISYGQLLNSMGYTIEGLYLVYFNPAEVKKLNFSPS